MDVVEQIVRLVVGVAGVSLIYLMGILHGLVWRFDENGD